MAKVDIFNPEWIEMVFEGKNHSYGAYVLRKENSGRHLRALIVGSVLFVGAVTAPILIKSIIPEKKEQDLTVRMLSEIKLEKPPEEVDQIARAAAPPPPPVRNTIKFTPPVIKPDEEVAEEDEPKTQKEVVDQRAAVGTVDFDKGTDDIEAPVATTENTVTQEEETPFVIVEQMPDFPGGQSELMKYISENVRYPVIAQENGIQGVVYVSFVVDRAGKVTRVQVSRGVDAALDKEAIRVVSGMPNWSPGKQGGRAVPVSYTVPIRFKLQ
ncbi:MAG: energy transducer TonB [Breznakibacter sp.]